MSESIISFLSGLFSEIYRLLSGWVIPGTSLTLWTLAVGCFALSALTLFVKIVFRQHVDDGTGGGKK